MWLQNQKKKLSFNSNQEFYALIDSLIGRLKRLNLAAPAQELHSILHESAWTTSSELLGELKLALVGIGTRHQGQLPRDVEQDITSCVSIIDEVWGRTNGRT